MICGSSYFFSSIFVARIAMLCLSLGFKHKYENPFNMNRLFKYPFSLLLFVAMVSCGGKKEHDAAALPAPRKAFPLPEIPAMLMSEADKSAFLALHYFDRIDLKDTILIHPPDELEKGVANFIVLLPQQPKVVIDSAITALFRKASAEPKMYSFFWKTLDRYLNDPNSPIRNEELYISVCQSIVKLPVIDEVIASNASFNLKQALKNRMGMKAADFQITLESGKQLQMNGLKGKYTLLFFYEPDCHTCIQAKAFMRQSGFLNNLLQNSIVTLVAFFPQDDKQLWLQRLPDCAPNWINGYDPDGYFTEKQPYDLRAFPTFYLLDKEKKVLLKDVPIEAIMQYLEQNR